MSTLPQNNPCAVPLCVLAAEPRSDFCQVHYDVHYDPIAGFIRADTKVIFILRDTSPKRKPKRKTAPLPAKKKKPSKPKSVKAKKKKPKPVKKPPLPQTPKRYAVPPQKPKNVPAPLPTLTPEQLEKRRMYAFQRTVGGFEREQKSGLICGVKLHPWKPKDLGPVSKTE